MTAKASDKQHYLQENDLFRGLSSAEVAALGERAPMKRVAAGTVFYSPEQPAEVLFILKAGRVRLYQISPDGRTLTTAVLEAGSIFGEMALLGQVLHDSFAEAMDPCLLCLMSREDVRQLLLGDPRIAARLVEILGTRLVEAQQQLAGFAFKQVPQRLAGILLRRARRPLSILGTLRPPEVRHTHEELADMLGVHRETVTKVLNEWGQVGIVELGRGRIRLLDLAALERQAAGQPG